MYFLAIFRAAGEYWGRLNRGLFSGNRSLKLNRVSMPVTMSFSNLSVEKFLGSNKILRSLGAEKWLWTTEAYRLLRRRGTWSRSRSCDNAFSGIWLPFGDRLRQNRSGHFVGVPCMYYDVDQGCQQLIEKKVSITHNLLNIIYLMK